MIDISIIIVSYNTKKLLIDCITSIIEMTKGVKYEIIVVDNASADDSRNAVKKLINNHNKIKISLISNKKNIGFGAANNMGMRESNGKYILLLNSDTVITNNAIYEMIKWMDKNKKVGISSCSLLNKDRTIQGTGGYFPTLANVFTWMTIQDLPFVDTIVKPFHPMKEKSLFKGSKLYNKTRELDWVTGAFFLIRRKVYEQIGGFDKDYFMYTEEVDYCYRAKKKGWKVMYNSSWEIIHLGGASAERYSFVVKEFEGVKTFFRKHRPRWQYLFLRIFLKLGSLLRTIIYALRGERVAVVNYAKAFISS